MPSISKHTQIYYAILEGVQYLLADECDKKKLLDIVYQMQLHSYPLHLQQRLAKKRSFGFFKD